MKLQQLFESSDWMFSAGASNGTDPVLYTRNGNNDTVFISHHVKDNQWSAGFIRGHDLKAMSDKDLYRVKSKEEVQAWLKKHEITEPSAEGWKRIGL